MLSADSIWCIFPPVPIFSCHRNFLISCQLMSVFNTINCIKGCWFWDSRCWRKALGKQNTHCSLLNLLFIYFYQYLIQKARYCNNSCYHISGIQSRSSPAVSSCLVWVSLPLQEIHSFEIVSFVCLVCSFILPRSPHIPFFFIFFQKKN